jgi:hypothetical protein
MAPPPHDQDITSWPQLLSAIEDAEAGQRTARLIEICLSVCSALTANLAPNAPLRQFLPR